jgi:hypothetical protein
VGQLWFDLDADRALKGLEADPGEARMLARVEAVLDLLERDAGDTTLRRVRFRDPPFWCVTVVAGEEERVILWEPHPTETDDVIVHYLGPASFA